MADDQTGDEPGNEPQGKTFTEEELNRLLQRERDKLHGRLDKATSKQAEMDAELARLRASDEARAQAEEQARKEAEEAARKAAEAEMSAKELIDKRTREMQAEQQKLQDQWAQQVSGLQQQLEQDRALFEREGEFQELANYTQGLVNAHQDEIAPELIDYIGGNTKEEIDASIQRAMEKTSAILAGIQNAQVQQRAADARSFHGRVYPGRPDGGSSGRHQDVYARGHRGHVERRVRAVPRGSSGLPAAPRNRGLFG